ncbi:MAG TPA: TraR/DksA C4-type zinc finger protein [Sediminibacterium sp.]|nr:TraR/DksA C4-type zinc finger protein [Sediminibacterium sp.]
MPTKKPAPKKAAPAKKAAAKPAPKKAAPAKKAAAKPASKKAAPAKKAAATPAPKKAVPAKKAAVKPVPKKAAPAPAKKPAAKPAPASPAKKAAVPVKAVPAPAPVKQQQPAVKPAPKPVPVTGVPKPAKKPLEPIKEVKVPKLNTKSSVPYQPGYTQLEKRTDTVRNNGEPLVRYSDADLNEFRELISKKLEAAKKELAYLQGLITRKDEMGGDNDDARYMTMEDGSMSMEREQLSQMASRQITYIDHLEKAMMRIENKTYGICRVTGKLIDKARLRAVPHATLSLEAKLGLVKAPTE